MSANACETLSPGPKGKVVEITDGDTLILDNSQKVRLIGMQAPKLPLGRVGFETWPLADEAKAFLADFALGEEVQIYYGTTRKDRHGRVLGHVFIDGSREKWAQKAVIANGLARVYSFYDNRHCLDELYAAERQARVDREGIWALDYYQIRQADKPHKLVQLAGRYELVEGRVLDVGESNGRIYLNFGRDWDSDFTVVIDKPARRAFKKADFDPKKLANAFIRVRGWVDDHNGPRIDVTHPEQIEILAVQ
nr:thermonuclease family protein [Maritalea mediterranea]